MTAPASLTRARIEAGHRLRRQRQVERLCETPRLVFELIEEVRRHHPGIAQDLDRRLANFAALDPAVLRALGGDRFAASPVRQVERAGAR
jgi:succinylglutamate desuccinylase